MFIITFFPLQKVQAQNKLQFKLGDKISVFAKKAIRRDEGRIFEAIGNTVILHGEETLYGHAARFDMNKMLFEINGNVRYLSKDMTLYGTYLNYNTKTRLLSVDNARLFTPEYRIVASKVEKISPTEYRAHQAEFTTCKDCTESWTIYGEEVNITTKQYVRVKNALMRIKGVDAFYLPYIVFPIKQARETGLLFPSIKSRISVGLTLAQPWFWAINQSSDATITPTFWAKRGYGGDVEYRKAFNQRSNFQLDSRFIRDDFFVEAFRNANSDLNNSEFFNNFPAFRYTGEELNRYVIDSELKYQWGYGHNSHIRAFELSDLDFYAEHPDYTQKRILGTEKGVKGFYNYRSEFFDTGVEFSSPKTLLDEDPLYYQDFFDHRDNSVSTLPRFYYAFSPYKIYKSDTDFFNLLYVGARIDVNQFQQTHFNEDQAISNGDPIRNATRVNFVPYISMNLFDNGIFSFTSTYEVDGQYYRFRRDSEKDFRKYSGQLRTTLNFGIEKVYGLAYQEKVSFADKKKEKVEEDEESKIIGKIPDFSEEEAEQEETTVFKSFKHAQEYNFIHYVTLGERESGNGTFRTQISEIQGWFDYYDSIRSRENEIGLNETRTQIPPQNTFEFQWNNSLVQKTPRSSVSLKDGAFLRDNFTYERTAWFNVSQGVELKSDEDDYENKLTRLAVMMGFAFNKKFMLGVEDYYFHDVNAHFAKFDLRNDFEFMKILNSFTYNEISNVKVHTWGVDFQLTDELTVLLKEDRDLEGNETTGRTYAINYVPSNDCWLISLGYRLAGEREDFSFDFALNFGNPGFFEKISRLF